MAGILVHGDNHFILSGPQPDKATAIELVHHWSVIRIGGEKSLRYKQWEIRTKEFRENLEWAVLAPGTGEISSGVAQLLAELSSRGVTIRNYRGEAPGS
jgi:hypothetical protein